MAIAIMQPTYLPWLGFFDLMDQVETFVFLDNVQMKKQSWQVRNKVKTPNGSLYLTIPIKKNRSWSETFINNAEFNDGMNWREKHLKSIDNFYKRAPYYEEVRGLLKEHLISEKEVLSQFNIELISSIAEKIGISTDLAVASSLRGVEGVKDQRLVSICKRFGTDEYISPKGSVGYIERNNKGGALGKESIEVYYHQYDHPEYPQLHGQFIPYLGIIDLLFNVGFENALNVIRKGRKDPLHTSRFTADPDQGHDRPN